ncbi:MAG: NAD(+) synthase [Gammaproteobacteria bacterium]
MHAKPLPFHSIYRHGYLRVAVCTPVVRVADPAFNLEQTLALAQRASEAAAALVIFPELGLSAYTNEDLFHQDALLDAVEDAAKALLVASETLTPVLAVGLPLRAEGKLFNCAALMYRGRTLGLVPKSFLPNYREFYEKRQFTSGFYAVRKSVQFLGDEVPFGSDLIFCAANYPDFRLHVEICEDLWVPIPPSTYGALAGATVLANLSASNITIGKADYRRHLCAMQSGKCIAAYLFAAAGPGESTTDLAWDGQALVYENAELLAESTRFAETAQMIYADVDLERLRQERMRTTSFNDCAAQHLQPAREMRDVPFEFQFPAKDLPLSRAIDRFPYVPSDPKLLDEHCYEAYNIQIDGLMQRLKATGLRRVVIGISGGIDSTQGLVVCAKTFHRLGIPRENILGYTMPGFATSEETRQNSWRLMRAFGITAREIDIRPACEQMLKDLQHPFSYGKKHYDITFENVQAGERTSHLFRLANYHEALVIGTSDLSELALGWTTYGVGDHMAHYSVNASVPKTLIQYLIRWVVRTGQFDETTSQVLLSVLATEISPELIPGEDGQKGPAQRTEEKIGPYELQDFTLYFVTRYGFRPSKVAFLAEHAWGDRKRGRWPEGFPDTDTARREYDLPTIKQWLGVFIQRFFQLSQFKRSAIPNAPKVGSGGSLSPRGDWRAPSDSKAEVWRRELEESVPGG